MSFVSYYVKLCEFLQRKNDVLLQQTCLLQSSLGCEGSPLINTFLCHDGLCWTQRWHYKPALAWMVASNKPRKLSHTNHVWIVLNLYLARILPGAPPVFTEDFIGFSVCSWKSSVCVCGGGGVTGDGNQLWRPPIKCCPCYDSIITWKNV